MTTPTPVAMAREMGLLDIIRDTRSDNPYPRGCPEREQFARAYLNERRDFRDATSALKGIKL